ncbi:YiiD C-terminal domain-containing protein [Aeoliella sp. ICT_H6.2]|uniref:YiiD C-terminal domain-containing protein n=1 Tax=Aeoliella straminimaris TaxID=2954799 RepID=A0A9X2JGS7_9BACT|nr:SAM-dependent methyltransferase [Aeoliella straminimaris]MCO6043888.1 YiiD C-terminal domain-containing protein [Aeoliella straminimaris]
MKEAQVKVDNKSPLFEISWEDDLALRMDPPMVTRYMRDQIPVLEFVDWRVVSVKPGEVETVLPLNPPSTNQHFTHQAALILLSADYSGGTALATLFWGWPVIGVHPVDSPRSVSMWLIKAEMKYIRPSTADLRVRVSIDAERREKIQRRFLAGKPVIETLTMHFMNGEEVVAEGICTYFARQSSALRSNGIDVGKVNSLYALKLTSSAEMIAGVRAQESGPLFVDPYAADMAGQHGMAVATRFCQRTPQLGPMVAARTRHLDDVLTNFVEAGGRHIVNVGVGWDMRPFRLQLPEGTTFFELDFPTTLEERQSRLDQLGIADPAGITRHQLPIDLRTMSLAETLNGHLPKEDPVLVIWEGMSMYFDDEGVTNVLCDMQQLLSHPDSLLWLDMVDREPVVNPEAFSESTQAFMRGMQVLGEPFTFGSDTPAEFIDECGLRCLDLVTSDLYFPEAADPVYSIYQFCTVAGASAPTNHVPKTYRKVTYHPPSRPVLMPHFQSNGSTANSSDVKSSR